MERNYRRCVSCRKVAHKSTFWRVVRVFPSRAIQFDDGIGRSAYICRDESCLRLAQKKNAFGRSLRVPVPPETYQVLWQRLSEAASNQNKLSQGGVEKAVTPINNSNG